MGVDIKSAKKEKAGDVVLTASGPATVSASPEVARQLAPHRVFELLFELEQELAARYKERPSVELYDASVHAEQLRRVLQKARL